MKITRIPADRVERPLHEGNYKWSGGKCVTVFDSTVFDSTVFDSTVVAVKTEVLGRGPVVIKVF